MLLAGETVNHQSLQVHTIVSDCNVEPSIIIVCMPLDSE